jgi:hypothetical protein
VLQELIRAVERGEVTAVGLVSLRADGTICTNWAWDPVRPDSIPWWAGLLAGVASLQKRLLDSRQPEPRPMPSVFSTPPKTTGGWLS